MFLDGVISPVPYNILALTACFSRQKSPGCIVQLVTCLIADPGVSSSIPAGSHTLVEIDHEIISTAILLPSADSRRVVVGYKQKFVHKVPVLVNCLVKFAQEKSVIR